MDQVTKGPAAFGAFHGIRRVLNPGLARPQPAHDLRRALVLLEVKIIFGERGEALADLVRVEQHLRDLTERESEREA